MALRPPVPELLTLELMNSSLQRRTHLALSVLECLAGSEAVSGADLAATIDTTNAYLPQVLAPLVTRGWVKSRRGPGGGYQITPAGREATLLEVIETVQGPVVDGRCALRDAPCPGEASCLVHDVWEQARRVLTQGLGSLPAVQVETKEKM